MRVYAALNKWKRQPFDYGNADCFQFACFIIKQMTGKDYAYGYDYQSEQEAKKVIDRVGKTGSLSDALDNVFGNRTDDPRDGDPCVVKVPLVGEATGVKAKGFIVCLTEKGLTRVPMRYFLTGWRV